MAYLCVPRSVDPCDTLCALACKFPSLPYKLHHSTTTGSNTRTGQSSWSIDLSLTFIHVRETDARVPLLIHNPAAPQTFGKTTMSLVEHVDLYPTTVEMAMGISVDKKTESIEGDSYAILFNAKTTPDPASEDAIWMNEWNASFTQYPRCAKKGDDYKNGTQTRCASVAKADFKYMVSEMLS